MATASTPRRARILELAERHSGDTRSIARDAGISIWRVRQWRRELRKDGAWPWENHWRGTPAIRVLERTADLPLWPGKNRWDVTDLRLDLQAGEMPDPVVRWGEIYRGASISGGTHHFYIDDCQFSGLWRYPSKVGVSNCAVAVEPNYSAGPRGVTPGWQVLQGISHKRWLARYWQERFGIRIIVDLNVHRDWWDIALLGVPRGWASYATRVQADEPDAWSNVEDAYDLAVQRAGTEDGLFFVVFGGGEATRRRCISNGWLWHRSTRVWRKPKPGKLPPTYVPPEHERHVHRMPPKPPPGLFDIDVSTLNTVDSTSTDPSAEAADSEERP